MMNLDMGEFVGQIIPIVIAYLMIPTVILAAFFIGRRVWQQQRGETPAKKTTTVSETASPDALSLLRSVSPEPVNRDPVDENALPDLDLLMSSLENPSPAPQVTPVRTATDGKYDVQLNTGQTSRAKEVLVILRDEHDGRLMVQMDDTAYRSLKHEPASRQKFTLLMKELSKVIMTEDDDSPAPVATTESVIETSIPEKQPEKQVEAPPLTEDIVQKATTRQSTPPPPRYDGRMPGDLPGYGFDDNPAKIEKGRFGGPKVEFDAPPQIDIATAIESYLQHKISHSPDFRGRNIHIHSAPGGGVKIEVDGAFYEFVDEVSDPTTRTFIQESIAEWQERQ